MARTLNKLTAVDVKAKSKPGRYGDGGGLWLQVGPTGGKSWLFRYTMGGKAHNMGLGSVDDLSLADARKMAGDCREMVAKGVDPLDSREEQRRQQALDAAKALTFKACALAYIEAHEPAWRNEKHRQQWRNTLETYAYSVFGDVSIQDVDTALVMKALEPIWTAKPETASRVRGRIESIIDYAKARGYREGENPARWKGHLKNLLAAPTKVRAVVHHPAIDYDRVGDFMTLLRKREALAARAMEFAILTAARSGEVLGAQWSEIDLDKAVWTIPGNRMKSGREHRVPLSPAAVKLLKALPRIQGEDHVFPGRKRGRPISVMGMTMVLRRMKREDITVHGFRSAFRDWCSERTAYPREVAEMALAHVVGDKVEAAYRRGDLFEKRRKLMEAWAEHCSKPAQKGSVVNLRTAG